MLSQVLRAKRKGRLPDLVAIGIENQAQVCRRDDPGALPEFIFKLARPPARISECEQALPRPFVAAKIPDRLAA